jgi:hypothetical protein
MSRRTAQATGRHRKLNRGTGQPLRVSRVAAKQWNELRPESSPRRSQLEPGLIERGAFQVKRLHRKAIVAFFPWNGSSGTQQQVPPPQKESRDPLKLARYYQSLLDSGQFENRAVLARYLGVSRARVTQVLRRLR